jgi:hypothetical protein
MMQYPFSIKSSPIAGKGLFLEAPVIQGSILYLPPDTMRIISEEDYERRVAAGDKKIIRTGTRFFGSQFLYLETDKDDPADFINHSEDANSLFMCGTLFALRDIAAGEEITLDYTLVVSKGEASGVIDVGRPLGIPDHRSVMIETLHMMLDALEVQVQSHSKRYASR